MPRLLSVNVGLPRDVTWNGKTVRTSVWKSPVSGRRMVRKLDIDGDAQADLAGQGGEQRAVFVYQMDSYHYWQSFLDRSDFTFGQFGEAGRARLSLDDQDTKRYLEDFDRCRKQRRPTRSCSTR
jgi:MOSC domain-containing protein YiiM